MLLWGGHSGGTKIRAPRIRQLDVEVSEDDPECATDQRTTTSVILRQP